MELEATPTGLSSHNEDLKRPLTIRACLILILALAADLALFRNASTNDQRQSAAVWLYAILVIFIWRYVGKPWDRYLYVALFVLPTALLLAGFAWYSAYGLLD